ncbi:10374_t:CDS:2, partial [Gigaspora rosea]
SKNFEWIKPYTLNEKLKLYTDIKEGKDLNEKDKKLRRSCVWGERKFLRTVVWLELRLKGLYDKVPANIIDESIDDALIARKNIIQKNLKDTKKSFLSFKSKKDLRQTMTIRAQNFSKKDWNHFYVTHLHNSSTLLSKRCKPNDFEGGKRDLCPFHFEKKRKHNKWPSQRIDCDCKLTYLYKTNECIFYWVYEAQKQICETQADVHVVSIDPGVRTPFTWYSSTKDAGKIGEYDIGPIFRMKRKISRLQEEIHRKTIKFLTDEFDMIVIHSFEVSNMFRQRLIPKAEEKGINVIIQNEAYTSKTCSWCGNIQNIGGSETHDLVIRHLHAGNNNFTLVMLSIDYY